MKYLAFTLTKASLLLSLSSAFAANDVAPGQYIRTKDSAWLRVERSESGMHFSLGSIGGNCHTCSVTGKIVGQVGYAEDETSNNADMNCRIQMRPSHEEQQLEVTPLTEDACREYCGMRAGFDGTYLRPPPNCSKSAQQKARDTFIQHYRAKRFQQAVAALSPVLSKCGVFLNWIEIDRLRNDLSLAYFHGGDATRCIQTLQDSNAASFANEDALREALPPCDFDNYIPTAKAAWHNMRLCGLRHVQRK